MTFTEVRAEIAAALNEADGITGYANTPSVFSVNDAWPRWTGMDAQGAPGVFSVNWQILVITGGTPADAEMIDETTVQAILDVLQTVVYVTNVAPTVIQTPSGDLYGLSITAVRE